MSNSLDLKIEPPSNLNQAFANFSPMNIQKALKASIEAAIKEINVQVEKGFNQEQTPGGEKWKALNPDYARWKATFAAGKGILELTGDLKESALSPQVQYGSSDDSGGDRDSDKTKMQATLVVTDRKAVWHEFGRGKIPARPFYAFEGEALDAILKASYDAFDKVVSK